MKKVNKTISLLLAVLIIFSSFSMSLTAFAAEETYTSGYYTYEIRSYGRDSYLYIIDCDTSISGDVTVPAVIDGYTVYSVDDDTFLGCTGITSMTIPSGIRSFDAVLTDCEKMTRLTVSNTVSLGEMSFPYGHCSEITMNEEYAVLEFDRSKNTTVVNVGADLENFTPFHRYFSVCVTAIEKINLNGNSNFVLVDGVLYTADMKTLCLYPTTSTRKHM